MTPQKMLTAQRIVREVIRANGLPMVGGAHTGYLLGRSLLKSLLIGCSALFGGTSYIVRARSRMKDEDMFRSVLEDIRKISSIDVDGK